MTEKELAAIKARHAEVDMLFERYGRSAIVYSSGPMMHDDRAKLIAEVERLQKENLRLRQTLDEEWEV
jgi:hypothetical protein